ncbi:MAG TPA: hypothetical protein VHB21_24500 [Minicystis sp.]|nr:hypothetical protein [Minicystis sp.]
MTKHVGASAVLLVASTALTGCAAVRGIFRAGVWSGVALVVVLVVIVAGVLSLLRAR